MNKSQFNITLAKSGQRVVTSAEEYENRGFNKRISDASFDYSTFSSSKRMRHDESARVYESNKLTDDFWVGPNDLRVKLMQKEISRRAHLEIAERKKIELYEKVSRAIKSAELEKSRPRKVENTMRTLNRRSPDRYSDGISNPIDERPQLLPMRQLDGQRIGHSFNEMPTRSPGGVIRYSSGIPNSIDERPQVVPLRQLYAPRPGRSFITDPVDSTRISVPLLTSSRGPLDSGRMITHLDSDRMVSQLPLGTGGMSRPPYLENQPEPYTESGMLGPPYPENQPHPVTSSGMLRSPYQENQPQPVTVSSLLNTIGLGKYAVTFEAEEIDMLALRQMGDCDLKEMGIPMGPRKKILHAVEAHTKRLIAQARSNYMQSIEFAR